MYICTPDQNVLAGRFLDGKEVYNWEGTFPLLSVCGVKKGNAVLKQIELN